MPATTQLNALHVGGAVEKPAQLLLAMANRHGLITGATGTGKTITLKCWPNTLAKRACRIDYGCERRCLGLAKGRRAPSQNN